MTDKRKRFRLTSEPGELLAGERELLDFLVALHREFPERDRISVDAITALTGRENPGTLAYLVQHAFLMRTNGDDGAAAYTVTEKGWRESRRATTFGVSVPR